MGQKKDINKIRCYIDLSRDGNNEMFSREEIHEAFNKEAVNCFKKYKLEYEIAPLAGLGGGGREFLLDIIKLAWENKDLIMMATSILKIFIAIPIAVRTALIKANSKHKPEVFVNLGLETQQDYKDRDLGFRIGLRLINLKRLSDEICINLKNKYPIFSFNQGFNLFIQPRHFIVNYELNNKYNNIFNSFRLNRLFRNLKIIDNRYINYNFTRFLLIVRRDDMLQTEGRIRMSKPYKRYFLFLSTKIISDLFH